jgi:flagellar basal body-associated protein FliL
VSAPAPAATAPGTAEEAPKKRSKKLLLIVVCLVAIGGGAAVPVAMGGSPFGGAKKNEKTEKKSDAKTAIVPVGEVAVNLREERLSRYLKVKLAVLVEADAEKAVLDMMTKKKAAVKSALITHMCGKSPKEVSGSEGVQRMQRELLERIEEVLYPDGNSKIKSVLFEEYVVQ